MPHEEEYVFSNPILKEINNSQNRMIEKMDEMTIKMQQMLTKLDDTSIKGEKSLKISEEKENQRQIKEEIDIPFYEIFINLINELLTKIQSLLNSGHQNNSNLENIPREEEKNEPRKLGFF